jgi:hypothetical protein
MGLLAAAAALAVPVSAVRLVRRAGGVPAAALYGATAASLALGCAALVVGGCYWAGLSHGVMFWLAMPTLFPRLPWYAQVAVQGVTVVMPWLVWEWTVTQFSLRPAVNAATQALLVVVFVGYRYVHARQHCLQFAVHHAAQDAARAAGGRAAQQRALLAGLLPPHVVPFVEVNGRGDEAAMPQYFELTRGLSIAQLSFAGGDVGVTAAANVATAALWKWLPAAIAEVTGGVLELVQATGDTALIAGPFVVANDSATGDSQRQEAACAVVQLLRHIKQHLPRDTHFTGVATAGNAYGALLGASLLTFRLFGAAVRESDALLHAAPHAPFSVAFATDGFRQQHNNFEVRHSAHDSDGGMSVARRDGPSEDSLAPSPEPHSPSYGPQKWLCLERAALFGPAVAWRVRGVGTAAVSEMRLSLSP